MLALLLFMVPSRRRRLLPGHWRPGPRDLVSAGTTAAAGAGFREAAPAPPASSPDSGVGAAPPRLGYRRLPQPAPVQIAETTIKRKFGLRLRTHPAMAKHSSHHPDPWKFQEEAVQCFWYLSNQD
ncbi:uncharacterized protein LOC106997514 isoform X1 [Macaca mulatta]